MWTLSTFNRPQEQCSAYMFLLQQAEMKCIYEEDTPLHISLILPYVQLLISVSAPGQAVPLLKAAS